MTKQAQVMVDMVSAKLKTMSTMTWACFVMPAMSLTTCAL